MTWLKLCLVTGLGIGATQLFAATATTTSIENYQPPTPRATVQVNTTTQSTAASTTGLSTQGMTTTGGAISNVGVATAPGTSTTQGVVSNVGNQPRDLRNMGNDPRELRPHVIKPTTEKVIIRRNR